MNKSTQNAEKSSEEEAAAAMNNSTNSSTNNSTNNNSGSGEFKGEIEAEQVWLHGLHQFIQQGNTIVAIICFHVIGTSLTYE